MCSNYPPTRNYCKELGINGPLGGTAFLRSAVIYTAFYESLVMFVICYLFFSMIIPGYSRAHSFSTSNGHLYKDCIHLSNMLKICANLFTDIFGKS